MINSSTINISLDISQKRSQLSSIRSNSQSKAGDSITSVLYGIMVTKRQVSVLNSGWQARGHRVCTQQNSWICPQHASMTKQKGTTC